MEWKPSDRFYPDISLTLDLGYGPEGERNITKNVLTSEGIEPDEETIKKTIELTRDVYIFLKENCEKEVQQYQQVIKEMRYVGGVIPLALALAKEITVWLIRGLIFGIGTKISEKIFNLIDRKKEKATESDDRKILDISKTAIWKILQDEKLGKKITSYEERIKIKKG